MKKILCPILTLILAACTSASPQTQVTVTRSAIVTVTLPPTATFTPVTPEPTDTLTPIPTATPFRYTSGADDELQAKIIAEAEKTFGMSVKDKIDQEIQNGNLDEGVAFNKLRGIYRAQMLYLGDAEVSLSHLQGASAEDKAVITYYAENNNEGVAIPVIAGYTYKGVFYQTNFVYPPANGGSAAPLNDVDSIEKLQAFLSENMNAGEVMRLEFKTFTVEKTPEEWLKFNLENQRSIFGYTGEQIFKLIALLDNGYLSRLAGNNGGASDVEKLLDTTLGDIGQFANLTIIAQTP